MTHFERIQHHLTSQPGSCDACLSDKLNIHLRQTVNSVTCLKAGWGISRALGVCLACGKTKVVNSLGNTTASDSKHDNPVKTAKQKTQNYVREDDLQERFNESLIATLGLPRENYYSRLDFDQLLKLKGGLARIHDIVTLKLTLALADTIA